MIKKSKYLQIFNYLLEFSKLRNKPVRDINLDDNNYPEILWLSDIPINDLFENIIRSNFDQENDYWINIKKPREPEKPEFTSPPKKLSPWIELSSLLDQGGKPILKEAIEEDNKTLLISDFPEITQGFEEYVKGKYIDDLNGYNVKLIEYNEKYSLFEKLNETYKNLFRIYNKVQQFGEEYELVIGVGVMNFKEGVEKPKIFRHIFTQRVDINFEYSQKESEICIVPNIESIIQIETDAIIDLVDQFDSQNIIDAEKATELFLKEKEANQLFTDNIISDALQIFADRVSPDGKFVDTIEKPNTTTEKPTIYFSPALLLRKRDTKSFSTLYKKILDNIENSDNEIDIPSIDDLIGVPNQSKGEDISSQSPDSIQSSNEPIFFPKEYNDEQIEIIEKSRRGNKVLVQGPPGTGKSHTIANLICHLLANGKKVLVTAYTPRALKVLKDKLPEEFQDLTVNLLSGDASSLQDLQKSVNAINNELSRANLNDYQKSIEEFNVRLSESRSNIAYNTNELIKIKEKATRNQEVNSMYIGTLTEIAERLEADTNKFDWYTDAYNGIEDKSIIDDLANFIHLNNGYNTVNTTDFNYLIPKVENLPTADQIKEYQDSVTSLSSYNAENIDHITIKCVDYNELKKMLIKLSDFYGQSKKIQVTIKGEIISSFLGGYHKEWNQKVALSSKIITRLEKFDLEKTDRDEEIIYKSGHSLKQLKNDAQKLLAYLQEGNSFQGIQFSLKKPFLSQDLKESLYLIKDVTINGSPCDTKEELETIIDDIEIKQDFEELSQLWSLDSINEKKYFNQYLLLNNTHQEVVSLINIIEESEKLRLEIKDFSEIVINPFNEGDVTRAIKECEYNYLLKIIEELRNIVKKAEINLNQENMHPIKEKILNDLNCIDHNSYQQTIKDLQEISERKAKYQEFKEIQTELQKTLPNLTENILSGSFIKDNLPNLINAFHFVDAQNKIHQIMDIEYEQRLFNELKEYEKQERNFIAKLASKKAWSKLIEGLQENRTLRQHLEAWMQAIKKIGKTGKGKRALKFRKEAQEQMEECKDSVPCRIMPLYKVAETISPEQGMYDYVIIDEASQVGVEAIFLMYISKNIIIVGDDKQTSPEYVGVDSNAMAPYIKRHLGEIPFKNYYDTTFSLFDHAKRFCDQAIVLREHFRCMPEIIEFSNRNFYAPESMGLYPLKQYSENRLDPLKTVFCKDGYTEGRGSSIINESEAKSIVDTISKLIEDKRYNDKSFGVITLQGNQQAAIIENLLLKKIGEQEFHKRKIICGNSSSFQGDERDIIFLSLVTAHNHNRSALTRPEDERRFNVAVSRAIEQIRLFHSVELDDLTNSDDLRYKLLDHFKNYNTKQFSDKKLIPVPKVKTKDTQPEPYDSWFEVEVRNDIISRNINVIPQYEVAKGKYRIDLVALNPDGTKIAIECDGDRWHGAEQYQNDMMRQKVLERCGWQFFRIRSYEYYTNREKALDPLREMLQSPNVEEDNKGPEVESEEKDSSMTLHLDSPQNEDIESPVLERSTSNDSDCSDKVGSGEEKATTDSLIGNRSRDSHEILVFTNKYNVYKLKNQNYNENNFLDQIEFDEEEKVVYATGIKDYSGYLIVAFENGKIGKIPLDSYKTEFNRKKLKNAFNGESKLLYIKHIEGDIDLVLLSSINKVVLFNTSQINPVESRTTKGVQVMKAKNGSKTVKVKDLEDTKLSDSEYYRKDGALNIVGYYIKNGDEI